VRNLNFYPVIIFIFITNFRVIGEMLELFPQSLWRGAENYCEWIYQYNCNKEFICYKLVECRDDESKPGRPVKQETVCWNGTSSSRDLVLPATLNQKWCLT